MKLKEQKRKTNAKQKLLITIESVFSNKNYLNQIVISVVEKTSCKSIRELFL